MTGDNSGRVLSKPDIFVPSKQDMDIRSCSDRIDRSFYILNTDYKTHLLNSVILKFSISLWISSL